VEAMALRQLGAAHEGRSGLLLTAETELLSCRRVFDVALIEAGRKKTSCCHVTAAVCRFGRKDPCYCAALAYCCTSSRSQVEESLPLAWQKIDALGVSVFCSFFTVLRPPLLFLHLLRNELLLAAERKGE